MAEKEHCWREESIAADPEEEFPIFEDSKKTLSRKTLKRILSMGNLKKTLINVKPKDNVITASVPSVTFAPQINSFWFFGNGIW